MFVNHDKKVVYIRVPKTGSSAIVTAMRNRHGWDLEPYDMGFHTHTRMCDIPSQFKKRYQDYDWVIGIRHPLTWIPSFYAWIAKNSATMKQLAFGEPANVPDNWLKFVDELCITPMMWGDDPDGIITQLIIHKQEDTTGLSKMLDVGLSERRNVTQRPRDFVPDEQVTELMNRKFHRELEFYKDEPLQGNIKILTQ